MNIPLLILCLVPQSVDTLWTVVFSSPISSIRISLSGGSGRMPSPGSEERRSNVSQSQYHPDTSIFFSI